MTNPIDTTGTFDSRDLIEYRDYLKEELVDYYNEYLEDHNLNVDDDEQQELIEDFNEIDTALEGFYDRFNSDIEHCENVDSFCEELEGYGDFIHGQTIISENYFTEYSEDLCKEMGEIPQDLPWYIANHINWDLVAGELKADYMEIDFENVTYLMRA